MMRAAHPPGSALGRLRRTAIQAARAEGPAIDHNRCSVLDSHSSPSRLALRAT